MAGPLSLMARWQCAMSKDDRMFLVGLMAATSPRLHTSRSFEGDQL